MEKEEKIREWAIEMAKELANKAGFVKVEEVIKEARKIEEYIKKG